MKFKDGDWLAALGKLEYPDYFITFSAIIINCLTMDVPDTGAIFDLLWTDPDKDVTGWTENDCGVSFIPRQDFEDGYELLAIQMLITVFCEPNY